MPDLDPQGSVAPARRCAPALALSLAVAIGAGCAPPAPRPEGNFNLLLVTLDTVRADFLEPYGFRQRSSPNLVAVAAEALVFEQAFATSSRTGPSHASILTARHPAHHGVLFNGIDLPGEIGSGSVTLAEHLRGAGFFTGGVVSAGTLDERFGFDRGFHTFEHERTRSRRQKPEAGGGADHVTDTALSWLRKHRARRFFLWVHYYEAHAPYHSEPSLWRALGMTPGEIVTMDSARAGAHSPESIRQSYRVEVFELDLQVGRLLDGLVRLGLDRGTVVAVVSDHGEYLGEHGQFGHQELFDEVLHVPMMIRSSTVKAGRRAELVSTIDLAPTLLGLLGAPPLPGAQGVDLFGPRPSSAEASHVFAEWRNHAPWLGEREALARDLMVCVRSARAKLIRDLLFPDQSLAFDLEQDPSEADNLLARGGGVPPDLEQALRDHLRDMPVGALSLGEQTLDPEVGAMLEALGY